MQVGMFDEDQRDEFMRLLKDGAALDCPCCRRHARIWRLKVHATLAMMLIRLYRKSMQLHGCGDQWVHIEAFKPETRTGNDFSIVKHWLLAEPKDADENDDKNSSGMWRLTEKGVRWIKKMDSVHKYARVFDNKVLSYEGDQITVDQALTNKFSYDELLNGKNPCNDRLAG